MDGHWGICIVPLFHGAVEDPGCHIFERNYLEQRDVLFLFDDQALITRRMRAGGGVRRGKGREGERCFSAAMGKARRCKENGRGGEGRGGEEEGVARG
jgi:hypothetical protein